MFKKIFIGTFVMLAVFISSQVSSAQEFTPVEDTTVVTETAPEDDTTVVEGDSEEEFVPEDDTTVVEGDSEEEFVPEDDTTVVEGEKEVTEETSSGSRSSGSRGRGGNGGSSLPSTPAVLGATTGPNGETLMCAPYLTTFMKIGKVNDVTEVKKLQTFLNEFNNANLPVTGFFGPMTHKAVIDLQAKYANEILKPWDIAGVTVNLQPTGYAYKMTQWFVNSKKCPEAQTALPVLN